MRRITTLAALAALSCGAFAQSDTTVNYTPVDLSLRAGVNIPVDSGMSDLGNTLFAFGLDYRFGRSLLANGESYLSVDYFTKNFRFEKGSVWPIAINQRFFVGDKATGTRTYMFAGLGIAVIDVNSTGTTALIRGGIGAELGDSIFFETAGYLSDKVDGVRANSFAFYLGYRF